VSVISPVERDVGQSVIGLPEAALVETGGCMSEVDREGRQPESKGTIAEPVRGALASNVPLAPGQVFPTAPDADAVLGLIESCRRHAPDASHEEIVHFIHVKRAIAKRSRVSDPLSHLLAAVPECFAGGDVSRYRAKLAEQAKRAAERAIKGEQAKKRAEEGGSALNAGGGHLTTDVRQEEAHLPDGT